MIFLLLLVLLALPASAQRVVFLGENHTSEADHRRQLEHLKSLEGPFVVAAEMFYTDPVVLSPEVWKREWGHPWELYRPIFEWLEEQRVPILALRPDPRYTAAVREHGPTVAVPWIDEVLLGPEAYRRHMAEIAAAHGAAPSPRTRPGPAPPGDESATPTEHTGSTQTLSSPSGAAPAATPTSDRYFVIQCFWDEYMAWRLHQIAKAYPEHRIAVLVGSGHLHPGMGIPWRLARRAPDLDWIVVNSPVTPP